MQPQLESERSVLRTNVITIDRPDSSQLVDLHIYIIPKAAWKDHQNLAANDAIEQATSAGFVRVPQNLTIYDLRQHIVDVCSSEDEFPKEFMYLRSVGRCLAKVKPQQETELKVKNYRPPITFAPEIYILEGHYDDDPSMTSKSKSYLSRESPIQRSSVTPPQGTTNHQQSWMKSIPESPPPPPMATTEHTSYVHFNEHRNSRLLNRSAVSSSSSSNFSRASSTLSARDLAKLRQEQERLRLRQIELARQRREIEEEQKRLGTANKEDSDESDHEEQSPKIGQEPQKHEEQKPDTKREEQRLEKEREEQKHKIEQEQQRREIEQAEQKRDKELLEKQRNLSKLKQEEEAAVRIQASYRGYRNRREIKEQKQKQREIGNFVKYRGLWSPDPEEERRRLSNKQSNLCAIPLERYRQWRDEHQWLNAHEIERLQKEARELTLRKAEEEHAEEIKAHDVVKLSARLEELKRERVELESNRETTIRRMQQLHAQIAVRRTEERDLWKQKYLTEKRKTVELEEKMQTTPKEQPDISSQVEQAKIRLNNSTKLRQQAENECHLLKQELDQMRLSMNTLQNHPLPNQLPSPKQQQQQQPKLPISFDITLQY